jgi:hypothetical protein
MFHRTMLHSTPYPFQTPVRTVVLSTLLVRPQSIFSYLPFCLLFQNAGCQPFFGNPSGDLCVRRSLFRWQICSYRDCEHVVANIRERALNRVGPSLMGVPHTQAYDSVCHPDIDERRQCLGTYQCRLWPDLCRVHDAHHWTHLSACFGVATHPCGTRDCTSVCFHNSG